MTEAKEDKQSSGDISGSVSNDPVALKMDMVCEKHTKKKEDIEKNGEGEEEEETEGEEEETEGEEEEEAEEEEEEEVEEEVEREEEGTEESEEDTEDEQENKLEAGPFDESIDGGKMLHVDVSIEKNSDSIVDSPIHGVENSKTVLAGDITPSVNLDNLVLEASVKNNTGTNQKPAIDDGKGSIIPDTEGHNGKSDAYDSLKDIRFDDEIVSRNQNSVLEELNNEAKTKEGTNDADERNPSQSFIFDSDTSGGGDSGSEDKLAAFITDLEKFHKERGLEFKPPKFYGGPLNLLKLWRSVMKLGGYDKVTACKYWRQVGESFNPPKTCTTVSWTFRIFYEKALLDYERYRTSSNGSSIPGSLAVTVGADNQASGSGRARRESAARAMKGWHSQRILDNGEVSDPLIKDKNSFSLSKKEKQLKNLGILKRKKSSSIDHPVKPVRTKVPKTQTESTVIDIGSPADWVKINVRVTKDCYEVYALVPGLLREEVRVQSDPAGRLVISGEPENPDNPWSVTPFKKVVSLPSRIDPHQTSAVVTLHGQLFVRVPFEQYD